MIINDNENKAELERQIREYMMRTAGMLRNVSAARALKEDMQSTESTAADRGLGYTTKNALKYKKKADKDLF